MPRLADASIPLVSRDDAVTSEMVLHETALVPAPERGPGRDSLLRRSLAVGDVLAVLLAYTVAFELTGRPLDRWTLLAALFVAPVNKLLGLYDRDAHVLNKTTIDELPKLFDSAVVLAFVAAGVNDLVGAQPGSLSARVLLALVLLTTGALVASRVLSRRFVRSIAADERCIVVGDDDASESLRRKLALSPTVGATIVGRTSIDACRRSDRDVREAIAQYSVDRLLVCPQGHDPDEVSDAIRAIRSFRVKISVVPPIADTIGAAIERDQVSGTDLVGLKDTQLSSSSRAVKRTLDIFVAGTALILLAPAMLAVAIAIRLDSAGPAFYRQRRIGRDGLPFVMLKFRTMVDGADRQQAALREHNESVGLFKLAEDPRITRVGHFLRRTSVDEVPQLFNVLRGDMSLVGPRPLVPDEDENICGWYRRRSQITPGMTGAWQLHGPVRIPLDEMVKLDYTYVATWSIWADLKILSQTVPHVLGRRGL
ncbi:MAG: sugar transferase [Thermoleophilaceae bacterium]|nr:sugar transferase [Thermoleophilaceae bacterium]